MNIAEFISNYKYTRDDKREIALIKSNLSERQKHYKASNRINELYILVTHTDFTPSDIAKYYNVGTRAIQLQLKNIGINMDKFESQRRAAIKRDYVDIQLKCRKTRAKVVCKSNIEEEIRYILYSELKLRFSNCEIIVGINSPCFFNRLEADIPIIMIDGNKIHKFIVEISGTHWHNDFERKDDEKEYYCLVNGYKYINVELKNTTTNVEKEAKNIVNEINKCLIQKSA